MTKAMAISNVARRYLAVLAAMALAVSACGSGGDDEAAVSPAAAGVERPTVVVTTNILGDVVGELIGDQAEVITIMPVGADPHDFQPSAQEVDQILSADALIVNGSDFEEGLLDVIDSARDAGVPTFGATEAVETIEFGAGGHNEHGHDEDKDHADEDHEDEHGDEDDHSDDEHEDEDDHADEDKDHADEDHGHDEHGHDGDDPHFFTDPVRMADAVDGIAAFLTAEVDGLDADAVETSATAYVDELNALDAEIEELIAAIPNDRRVLITDHEVFGYFADQYGFEVVGTVIPGGSTVDSASAGELAELAEIIRDEGVPAIFANTSSSYRLVETLSAEVGGVEVVELFSESLGESGSGGETYLDMVRTNATRISAALS